MGGATSIARFCVLAAALMLPVSCSDSTLSYLFDIPEKETAPAPARAPAAAAPGATAPTAAAEQERPIAESAKTWQEALKLLPLDRPVRKGRVNWTEAVRKGIIKPRDGIDGKPPKGHFVFKYDFYYPAPPKDPGFEVYFPHSTHTEWMGCEACHPRIFPIRGGEKFTKKDLKKGEYCGVCHRTKQGTAFWLRACDRCHPKAEESE